MWIGKNIEHFGGDPSLVTLLGWGAGADMVTSLTATRFVLNLESIVIKLGLTSLAGICQFVFRAYLAAPVAVNICFCVDDTLSVKNCTTVFDLKRIYNNSRVIKYSFTNYNARQIKTIRIVFFFFLPINKT